ncbi:MAG: WGR domain-containing protein [Piscirickettsiaceae bacterium]|nr:WGR domain-containing protein [Piscirickettsiaceae bacterium]
MDEITLSHSQFVHETKDYDVFTLSNRKSGTTIVLKRYGKIGTRGRVDKKIYENANAAVAIAEARRDVAKTVENRINNGYKRGVSIDDVKTRSITRVKGFLGLYAHDILLGDFVKLMGDESLEETADLELLTPVMLEDVVEETASKDPNWGSW